MKRIGNVCKYNMQKNLKKYCADHLLTKHVIAKYCLFLIFTFETLLSRALYSLSFIPFILSTLLTFYPSGAWSHSIRVSCFPRFLHFWEFRWHDPVHYSWHLLHFQTAFTIFLTFWWLISVSCIVYNNCSKYGTWAKWDYRDAYS